MPDNNIVEHHFALDNSIVRHCKAVEILFISDILSCSAYIRINLHAIMLVIIFLESLHIGGWGKTSAKNSKMPRELYMMMMLIFPKCCNVSFGQTLFFKFAIKTLDRWRHQKRLWRHRFDLSNFWFESKLLTLIHNLSHQHRTSHFSKLKFGNDVTKTDVINFKVNFFSPARKNQSLFKIWLFHNSWIGCWTVKALWH